MARTTLAVEKQESKTVSQNF